MLGVTSRRFRVLCFGGHVGGVRVVFGGVERVYVKV